MNLLRVAKNPLEAAQHSVHAADGFRVPRSAFRVGVGLVEPAGHADAAGDAVEFGHGQAGFREQQIGADDPRPVALECAVPLPFDQFGGLAPVEQCRDPRRLFAGDALAIEQIDRAIKLQADAAERFNFLRRFRAERKRSRGDTPRLVGEQAAGRQLGTDEFRRLRRGLWGRRILNALQTHRRILPENIDWAIPPRSGNATGPTEANEVNKDGAAKTHGLTFRSPAPFG